MEGPGNKIFRMAAFLPTSVRGGSAGPEVRQWSRSQVAHYPGRRGQEGEAGRVDRAHLFCSYQFSTNVQTPELGPRRALKPPRTGITGKCRQDWAE